MSDQKLSQLQRTFFKIDDSEANNMNQFIPSSNFSILTFWPKNQFWCQMFPRRDPRRPKII